MTAQSNGLTEPSVIKVLVRYKDLRKSLSLAINYVQAATDFERRCKLTITLFRKFYSVMNSIFQTKVRKWFPADRRQRL
jgi:hypothetical protein